MKKIFVFIVFLALFAAELAHATHENERDQFFEDQLDKECPPRRLSRGETLTRHDEIIVEVTRLDPTSLRNITLSELNDPDPFGLHMTFQFNYKKRGVGVPFPPIKSMKFRETRENALALTETYIVSFPTMRFICLNAVDSLDIQIVRSVFNTKSIFTRSGPHYYEDNFVALADINLDDLSTKPIKLNFPDFIDATVRIKKAN
jgi:hypothetical protein